MRSASIYTCEKFHRNDYHLCHWPRPDNCHASSQWICFTVLRTLNVWKTVKLFADGRSAANRIGSGCLRHQLKFLMTQSVRCFAYVQPTAILDISRHRAIYRDLWPNLFDRNCVRWIRGGRFGIDSDLAPRKPESGRYEKWRCCG